MAKGLLLESQGRDISHMEVGQPSSGAPKEVIDEAIKALTSDKIGYTNALDLTAPVLCDRLLEEAGVAITPGIDFEDPESGLGLQRIRFSYSRSNEEVRNGMNKFKSWWIDHYPHVNND
eukprot:gene23560-30549_t